MVTVGILPFMEKFPTVEPGTEPGTSLLVFRDSDHYTTRLVKFQKVGVRISTGLFVYAYMIGSI